MLKEEALNKIRGCLIGGAIGDALGYPIEFLKYNEIINKYGENGVEDLILNNGTALISDDTQMTLFTTEAILNYLNNKRMGIPIPLINNIYNSYLDWFSTQGGNVFHFSISKLKDIKELNDLRAPGRTCLSALGSGNMGTTSNPINSSKGCGGVMRVAPLGLILNYGEIDAYLKIGSAAAAITHGHELGYLPAALLVGIIRNIMLDNKLSLLDIIKKSLNEVTKLYKDLKHINELEAIVAKAIANALDKTLDEKEGLKALGEGWVGEEAIAIAIYCALRHQDDFHKAICLAVNHSGDSDSTGAICGNILGCYLGYDKINGFSLDRLELKALMLTLSDELLKLDC